MTLVLLFSLVNIAIAWYFERKRAHVATVLHAVFFSVLLVFLMVASDNGYIVTTMRSLFGQDLYEGLRDAIYAPTSLVSVFAELEILVTALSVLATVVAVKKAVSLLIRMWKKKRNIYRPIWKEERVIRPLRTVKILQLHCRQNC